MPDQKPIRTRCLGGFSVMWVTKLLISPVKKRIFCPKTTKFGPKLAVLVNLGQAMQAYLVPCWWVSWRLWRAGCISQDTYLLYLSDSDLYAKHAKTCGSATAANARREPKVKPGSIARKAERNCGKNCQREVKIGCWSLKMVLETMVSVIIEKSYTIQIDLTSFLVSAVS